MFLKHHPFGTNVAVVTFMFMAIIAMAFWVANVHYVSYSHIVHVMLFSIEIKYLMKKFRSLCLESNYTWNTKLDQQMHSSS